MTQPSQNDHDQVEWEYEYDDNEQEDFYVPLVFHSAAINWRSKGAQRRVARESKRQKRQKPNVDDDGLDPTTLDPDAPSRRQLENHIPRKRRKRAGRDPNEGFNQAEKIRQERDAIREDIAIEDAQGDRNHVQILDLHGQNPLVSFRGRWYSCQWGHQIGTSMMFAEKKESENSQVFQEAAGRFDQSLPDFDIIALSDTNLIAEEKTLQYRKELPRAPVNAGNEKSVQRSNGQTTQDTSDSLRPSAPSIPIAHPFNGPPDRATPKQAPETSIPSDLRSLQSSFLTKLQLIKQQKGETDGDLVHDSNRFSRPTTNPLDHTPGSLEEMRESFNSGHPQSNQVHTSVSSGPGRPRSFPVYSQSHRGVSGSPAHLVSEDPGEGPSSNPTQVSISGRGGISMSMAMAGVGFDDTVMDEAPANRSRGEHA